MVGKTSFVSYLHISRATLSVAAYVRHINCSKSLSKMKYFSKNYFY